MTDIPIHQLLSHSKFCVRCYPTKKVQAEFTYFGNSLCEKCLKWFFDNKIRPTQWGNDGKINNDEPHREKSGDY